MLETWSRQWSELSDVYDAARLVEVVADFAPDTVIHQLTDLPNDAALIPDYLARNASIRTEGTRNLIAAAREASVPRLLAQSIAWMSTRAHEAMVLKAGGVVLRLRGAERLAEKASVRSGS